jgi:hypothetical protein
MEYNSKVGFNRQIHRTSSSIKFHIQNIILDIEGFLALHLVVLFSYSSLELLLGVGFSSPMVNKVTSISY